MRICVWMSANIQKFSGLANALHFQTPSAEAQSGLERLFALQEEFEAELKRYEERLEEEREREQESTISSVNN